VRVIVADYADEAAQDEPTPETLLAATLALGVAVDQLTKPGLEYLDRSPATDDAVQLVDAEHAAHARDLQAAHALAMHQRDEMGILRARARITAHDLRARARAVTTATLPSLLEQLVDAVFSTRGAGNRAVSVHRAAIGFDAAELLGHIQRAVYARPDEDLTPKLRSWAEHVVAEQNATTLPDAALLAEAWVTRARDVLTPKRSFELAAHCPACGNRWAYGVDDTGLRVKKSVLQVFDAERVARCIHPSCGQRWPESHWPLLIAALNQDREERAG
jgi:hypothetical protein